MNKILSLLLALSLFSFLSGCSTNPYALASKEYTKKATALYAQAYEKGIYDFKMDLYFMEYLTEQKGVDPTDSAITEVTDYSFNAKDIAKIRHYSVFDVSPRKYDHVSDVEFQFFRQEKDDPTLFYGVMGCTLPTGEQGYVYVPFIDLNDVYGSTLVASKGLCYADFASIDIGSTFADVGAIDPSVWIFEPPKVAVDEFPDGPTEYPKKKTAHVVEEGVVVIKYECRSNDGVFRVVRMELCRRDDDDAWIRPGNATTPFYINPADLPPRTDPLPTEDPPPDIVQNEPVDPAIHGNYPQQNVDGERIYIE